MGKLINTSDTEKGPEKSGTVLPDEARARVFADARDFLENSVATKERRDLVKTIKARDEFYKTISSDEAKRRTALAKELTGLEMPVAPANRQLSDQDLHAIEDFNAVINSLRAVIWEKERVYLEEKAVPEAQKAYDKIGEKIEALSRKISELKTSQGNAKQRLKFMKGQLGARNNQSPKVESVFTKENPNATGLLTNMMVGSGRRVG